MACDEDRLLAEAIGEGFGKDDPNNLNHAAAHKKQAQTNGSGIGAVRIHQQAEGVQGGFPAGHRAGPHGCETDLIEEMP